MTKPTERNLERARGICDAWRNAGQPWGETRNEAEDIHKRYEPRFVIVYALAMDELEREAEARGRAEMKNWRGAMTPCCADGCKRLADVCSVHAQQEAEKAEQRGAERAYEDAAGWHDGESKMLQNRIETLCENPLRKARATEDGSLYECTELERWHRDCAAAIRARGEMSEASEKLK